MKSNQFVYCKSKLDIISKTTLKGKKVDVLYCILDGEVYVLQGFKFINLSLKHFAEGMNIDLRVAQALVSGESTSIEEAKNLFEEVKEDIVHKTEDVKAKVVKKEEDLMTAASDEHNKISNLDYDNLKLDYDNLKSDLDLDSNRVVITRSEYEELLKYKEIVKAIEEPIETFNIEDGEAEEQETIEESEDDIEE